MSRSSLEGRMGERTFVDAGQGAAAAGRRPALRGWFMGSFSRVREGGLSCRKCSRRGHGLARQRPRHR